MTMQTFEMLLTFVVLGAVFLIFIREWLPVDMAALGGMCVLLAVGVASNAGEPAFSIFEISGLGLIYAAIGFLYFSFIGYRLLPNRDTVSSLLDAEVLAVLSMVERARRRF